MSKTSSSLSTVTRSSHFLDVAEEKNQKLPPIQGYENKPLVSLEEAVKPIESLVPDVQKMVTYAKEGAGASFKNLSLDEFASIKLYTLQWEPGEKSFFYILNQTLRAEDRNKLKPWFLFLKLILTALEHLSSISGKVYRGVKLDLSNQYTAGTTFTWWGFSSCTSSSDVLEADQFLGTRGKRTKFIINCKSGKDIRKLSFYQNEFEVLLPPAIRLRVIECLKSSDLTTIRLEELSSEATAFPSASTFPSASYSNDRLKDLIHRCESNDSIFLDNRHLTDEDMWIVVQEALNEKRCVELDLSRNRGITADGISIIALALKTNKNLVSFSLTKNSKFSNESTEVLVRGLKINRHLRVLDLSENAIEDSGAEQLAEMLKVNQTLRDLDLSNNHIHNEGVKHLASALRQSNRTLERLSLDWNPMADGCVNALIEMLKHNRSLERLEILQTLTLSVEAKARLSNNIIADELYDTSKILKSHPEPLSDMNSSFLGPINIAQHWGESLFGYYVINDDFIIRKHGAVIVTADVDVIIFYVSNAITNRDIYQKFCSIYTDIRPKGGRTSQIAFLCQTGPDQWAWLEIHLQHVFPNSAGEQEEAAVGIVQNYTTINYNTTAPMSCPYAFGRSYHNHSMDNRTIDAMNWGYHFAEQ